MEKLKVLIADQNVLIRKLISNAVELTEFGKVERVASNGNIAIEWMGQSHVDVVILDVCILRTDGMHILSTIKREYPDVEVIVSSTHDPKDASVTLEALKLGALDFILKPSGQNEENNIQSIKSSLQMHFTQIKVEKYSLPAYEAVRQKTTEITSLGVPDKSSLQKSVLSREKKEWNGADLVLIASSTGGPNALETVLCGLPSGFSIPILVVQHMPPDFTDILAQALDKKCSIRVKEAKDSEVLSNGTAFIAPGGFHMTVDSGENSNMIIRLDKTQYVNGVRPSADVLFRSVSKAFSRRNILAVILTGMGNDGTLGVDEIQKSCNCYCITQSEKTCVVYGMPRNVFEAGFSNEAVDIGLIADRIVQISQSGDLRK